MDSLQWPMTVTVTPDSIMRGEFAVTLYVSIRADPNEETASATDLKDNLLTRIPRNQPRQAWWEPLCCWHRADSRLVPSQWETSLQSNTVSHWLGANLESALWHEPLSQAMLVTESRPSLPKHAASLQPAVTMMPPDRKGRRKSRISSSSPKEGPSYKGNILMV